MPDELKSESASPARLASLRAIAPAAFAVGGVAAAFGAASCCALPVLLGGIGLGSLGSALFTPALAPFRSDLMVAAAIGLAAGGALLWRRRVCVCGTRLATTMTAIGLALGAALLAMGFAVG